MMQVERNWLNPDGIPGRPWFKHMLYGARFTYAHLELPGLTEAVEKKTGQPLASKPSSATCTREKYQAAQRTERPPASLTSQKKTRTPSTSRRL